MADGISFMEIDGFRNALNGHALPTLLNLVTDDVAIQDELGGTRSGKTLFGENWKKWFAAFPDLTVSSRATTIEGWNAILEVTVTGTNTGPLALPNGQSFAATNKSVRTEAAWALRFNSAGKLAGIRIYGNPSTLLTQLGVSTATSPP